MRVPLQLHEGTAQTAQIPNADSGVVPCSNLKGWGTDSELRLGLRQRGWGLGAGGDQKVLAAGVEVDVADLDAVRLARGHGGSGEGGNVRM